MSINIPVKIGKKTAFIRSDSRQYILGFDVTSVNQKSGETEVRFDPIGFYMSLTALLNALMKFKIRSSTAKTLEELKQEIIKAKESVLGYYDETVNSELNELNKIGSEIEKGDKKS